MEFKEYKDLKVMEQLEYDYNPTQTIILKGQWLRNLEFEIGKK